MPIYRKQGQGLLRTATSPKRLKEVVWARISARRNLDESKSLP